MRRHSYAILFLLALLITCASAYAASRLFLPAGQSEERSRTGWTPPSASSPTIAAGQTPAIAQPTRTPVQTPTPSPRASAVTPSPQPLTATPTPTRELQPSPTLGLGASPTATATAAPTATPLLSQYPYALVHPVRDTTGDCPGSPGNYVLGSVIDRRGNLLPDISLQLIDEFGNRDIKATKAVAGDIGRYDFPISGPARRFFLTVVDAQGQPLSPTAEISHGLGSTAETNCHWADWEQR